ncbi:hypothetical protein BE04_24270 [Sorangium cellulosum]|uniref:Endonuclease GajA/Old nuclease/RecF-like AAA domain-containing protein n=1 Tax=Sorangium cellulosum TaxID=56 RepID=A0A150P4C2_SORCE|nr:hypothetical protein BE04_24270 [Sorangium cellulosum]
MITRLEVDGFKSLREFSVDFEPFTVLVGPNSAGKSNILDALALLSRLAARPIEEAFKQGRGRSIDQFTRRRGEAGQVIRFAVELLLPGLAESGEAAATVAPLPLRAVHRAPRAPDGGGAPRGSRRTAAPRGARR